MKIPVDRIVITRPDNGDSEKEVNFYDHNADDYDHDGESGNNCDHEYASEKTSPQGRGHHKQTKYCWNCSLMDIVNIKNNCFSYLDMLIQL